MEERDLLMMIALIASVRTARFPAAELQGMASPRAVAEIAASTWIARTICRRVRDDKDADRASAERDQREAATKGVGG